MPSARSGQATSLAAAPAVLPVTVVSATRAADILKNLFPRARVTVDKPASAIIVVAKPADVAAMRQILAGIDVQNPRRAITEALDIGPIDKRDITAKLRRIYPAARFETGPNHTVLVSASTLDIADIKAMIAGIASAVPSAQPAETVRISQGSAKRVARTVSSVVRTVQANVSGSTIILSGAPEDVARAKSLASAMDQPPGTTRYLQVYRFRFVEAQSVANLLARSFHDIAITVDKDLNALSVSASAAEHARIADAVAQLDANPLGNVTGAGGPPIAQPGSVQATMGLAGTSVEVVSLKAATPGVNGSLSTTASDIANTVLQALNPVSPDLHIAIQPNSTQLVLTGSQYSVNLAKGLIAKLDVTQKLVVLDTEILEVDATVAKNLGISAGTPGTPFLSTNFGEVQTNVFNSATGTTTSAPIFGITKIQHSPLSLNVALNAYINNGKARILADPKITTISGRTATIRAGDNISVLTTTPGSVGVPPTSQIQSFQTGITLDITPVINSGNFITVYLHPTVNSLTSTSAQGIPQISTRDTQTTVGMQEDQTLVIGGLIQDNTTSEEAKIPLLGDLPVVGKAFRNSTYNHQRNELVITVTPHIIVPGSGITNVPAVSETPAPFVTLAPDIPLPSARPPAGTQSTNGRSGARVPPPFIPGAPPISPVIPQPAKSLLPGQRPTAVVPDATATPLTLSTVGGPPGSYTYGRPPSSTFAGPNDAAQIFYVTLSPNVVKLNTPVTFSAITTANVSKLVLSIGSAPLTVMQNSAPGQWSSTFPFNTGLIPQGAGPAVQLTLTATKADGTATSIQFPITAAP